MKPASTDMGIVADRIRTIATDARKSGHEVIATELFEVAGEIVRINRCDLQEDITVGAIEGVSYAERIGRGEDSLSRLLDLMCVSRIVLERSPSDSAFTVERSNGEGKDEEGA